MEPDDASKDLSTTTAGNLQLAENRSSYILAEALHQVLRDKDAITLRKPLTPTPWARGRPREENQGVLLPGASESRPRYGLRGPPLKTRKSLLF